MLLRTTLEHYDLSNYFVELVRLFFAKLSMLFTKPVLLPLFLLISLGTVVSLVGS